MQTSGESLLAVENLTLEFRTPQGPLRAVEDLSFSLEAGRTLGIVGESGCGKSVTALSLLRLLPDNARIAAGSIRLDGSDVTTLSPKALRVLRGLSCGMIFQEPMTSLNPVYSVGFQIGEALKVHHRKMSSREIREEVLAMLAKVGIPDPIARYRAYPHELSGGMRQRVMIAMALICRPKLLIADEPTTALDVTIQAQILDLMRALQEEFKMALILITHDLGVVSELADEVMVMYAGRCVERAKAKEIFSSPLHPYTRGLLQAIPRLDTIQARTWQRERGHRLNGIPGMVPSLFELPKGCRFQDRCSVARNECRKEEPKLKTEGQNHWVSCYEVSHA